MKQMRLLMGMPITVEIVDPAATQDDLERVFAYFTQIDETFSTYKGTSEISRLNRFMLRESACSSDVRTILKLADETNALTQGYFDIRRPDGTIDPSGIVKGWAIRNAARQLDAKGWKNFYVEAGGDIEVRGRNTQGEAWQIGIRDPFVQSNIVKVVHLQDAGIATSGTYIRGQHIRNPFAPGQPITDIVSLTVIGPNVYEADRFATAAFAMGRAGITFIERLAGCEGYMIDQSGVATMTSGFSAFTPRHAALDR
ncbi:MAG: FAD:protein FMN transferase [Candidatus Peribacter sp.]|nr:FAD:protein FMN transferase [Candidatus Peribacter sp.]